MQTSPNIFLQNSEIITTVTSVKKEEHEQHSISKMFAAVEPNFCASVDFLLAALQEKEITNY